MPCTIAVSWWLGYHKASRNPREFHAVLRDTSLVPSANILQWLMLENARALVWLYSGDRFLNLLHNEVLIQCFVARVRQGECLFVVVEQDCTSGIRGWIEFRFPRFPCCLRQHCKNLFWKVECRSARRVKMAFLIYWKLSWLIETCDSVLAERTCISLFVLTIMPLLTHHALCSFPYVVNYLERQNLNRIAIFCVVDWIKHTEAPKETALL